MTAQVRRIPVWWAGFHAASEREELTPEAREAGQAEARGQPEDEREAEAGRHLAQRRSHDGEVDRAPAVLEARRR